MTLLKQKNVNVKKSFCRHYTCSESQTRGCDKIIAS